MTDRQDWDQLAAYRAMRGPAWRWHLAGESVTGEEMGFLATRDKLATEATEYRALLAEEPDGAEKAWKKRPWIYLARELEDGKGRIEQLKLMVLGRCEPHEICGKLGIDPSVFRIWYELYFDVRCPDASSWWFQSHVMTPTFEVDPERACRYQLAAIGGPAAVWMLTEGDCDEALRKSRELYQRRIRMAARVQQAADKIPLNSRSALKLLKLSVQHSIDEQRLKQAEQKLAEKCRAAERKHLVALARQKRVQQREQRRYAERERKRDEKAAIKEAKRQMEMYCQQLAVEAELAERQAIYERARTSPLAALTWQPASTPVQPCPAPEMVPTADYAPVRPMGPPPAQVPLMPAARMPVHYPAATSAGTQNKLLLPAAVG